MKKREEMTKDAAIYGSSFFGASIISGFIRGFFVARVLGPSTYGLLSAYKILLTYSQNSHLGTISAMNRDVPYYAGKGNKEKVSQITNTVFSICLFSAMAVALGVLLFSYLPKGSEYVIGLRIVAFIVIAQQMYAFYVGVLRANKSFTLLSKSVVLYAIVDIAMIILLTLTFGIYGTLLSFFMTSTLLIFYIHRKTGYRFSIRFKVGEVIEQIGLGFPILLTVIMETFLESVDKLFILAMLSYEDLGYYSLGAVILAFMLQVPSVASVVLLPNISERYGEGKGITHLKKYLEVPTIGLAYITALLTGVALLLLHFLFYFLLPDYTLGFGAAKILILCAFFSAFSITSGVILVTIHKQNKIVVIQIFTVALAFLLNYTFIKAGMGIGGVAMATLVSYSVLSTAKISYTLKNFGMGGGEILNFFGRGLLPFLYLLSVVFILDVCIPNNDSILIIDTLITTFKFLLYSILSSPVIFILEKETGILRSMKKMVK